jgi:transcriptional regulator with XRE-family HTH domain
MRTVPPTVAPMSAGKAKPSPEAIALGRRIRRLRERLDVTQEQLAERVQRHRETIGSWERGEQTPYVLDVPPLAAALQVSCDQLLTGKDVEETEQIVLPREETAYFVVDEDLHRVLAAKKLDDVRALFVRGIEYGLEIPPGARRVTPTEYGDIATKVRAKIAQLGGIPREWE